MGRMLLAASLGLACTAVCAQESPPPENTAGNPPQSEPATAQAIPVAPVASSDAANAPQSDPGVVQLDEVVVTAQKRVESLQKTPVSVTAFNAEKLQLRGIEGVADLGSNVPGATIEPFPINMATLRIFIRGVGILDSQVTQDAAIGVYQDGVYIGRSVGLAFDVADLERIEVLRGPQGTLYGRNTTGGAISIITRKPSTEGFTMTHKLTAGNRNDFVGKSTVNAPITDDLAVKLAVLGSRRDGFVKNSGAGMDFGDRQDKSARFDLRWLANGWLTADYSYDYSKLVYAQYMYQAILTPEADHGLANAFKRYAQTQTVYSHQRLGTLSSGAPMEPSSVKIDGHALTLAGNGEGYELKYIGARRTLYDLAYADLSGGNGNENYRLDSNYYGGAAALAANNNLPVQVAWLRTGQSQWSHELQLAGEGFGDKLRYIAGAFYFTERAYEDRINPITHQFHSQVGPDQISAIILANPQLSGDLLNLTSPRLVNLIKNLRNDISNQSVAYYTQGTWTPDWLDSRLHLTLGYRHTTDTRDAVKTYESLIYAEGVKGVTPTAVLVPATQGNDTFDHVHGHRRFVNNSWAYITAYDLTPDFNVYAKYVQAYKSGGFDTRDPQVSGATGAASDGNTYGFGFKEGFSPEYVNSTEAGFKSEWVERRLRLNVNLFNMDYTDRQISALLSGTIADTKTRNVGRSRIRGVEIDTTGAVSKGWVLSLEYSYLDAKTLEVRDFNGNNVASNYQPYAAPHNSFVLASDLTLLERSWGALHSYVSYNYMDHRNGQTLPGHAGLTALDAYGLLNARIGIDRIHAGSKGALDVALWGKNLLDKQYPITAIDNLPQADRSVIWGEPRTFGLDLTYHWY